MSVICKLNIAIDNFQWGPPSGQNVRVGPDKAPPFKANCTIRFFDEFILFTKKAGHKELGQTTGFANAYGPKTTDYPMVRVIWNARILQNVYSRHQFFLLAQAKGLWWTMPAFRIVVSIKAASAQLVDLYVNACVRWWLFNTVNAFGLKDVGFITFMKPISVMAVNDWVPAPFSKMSTNALWTLSNTLISLESASGFESKCFYTRSMQQISNRNSDVPFASILCCLTTHDFSFVKGLIFQSEPYRMTRLMQILQLFVRCELSTFKTCFAELTFLLDPISPEFCQLGEIQWNWANLGTLAHRLPSWQLSGGIFKCQRLQCWFCSFSLRLYRWGREWTL